MDPHIKSFEFLEKSPGKTVVKTGFEAEIMVSKAVIIQAYSMVNTNTIEKMEAF